MSKKIGRNQQCPCGSGKKYKMCCGSIKNRFNIGVINIIKKSEEENLILNIQRMRQQGLGKQIISAKHNDQRIILVGNKIYKGNWLTFHDFLLDYIKFVFGAEWIKKEASKTFEKRHPLTQMFNKLTDLQKEVIKSQGKIYSIPRKGFVIFCYQLSYNLYVIAHNASLQRKLIKRLKNPEQFDGAYYEVYVAAMFIKAGFNLDFEDEDDPSKSHCEFIATHIKSGKKYSVEAKQRSRKSVISPSSRVTSYELDKGVERLIRDALNKEAKNQRIIFIDINLPAGKTDNFCNENFNKIIQLKENELINNQENKSAYVFFTNYPYHYDNDSCDHKILVSAEGLGIPNFGTRETNLHDAITAREKHKPIFELFESIKLHDSIPSTFNGEIPEFEFNEKVNRFIVGNTYFLKNENGEEIKAQLVDAVVNETSKCLVGLYKVEEGAISILTNPMTESELAAYRAHPDTFFGVHKRRPRYARTPLELYDIFCEQLRDLPRAELLNRLKGHPQFNDIRDKTTVDLLKVYCEGLVMTFWKE